MNKPKLQLALENQNLIQALAEAQKTQSQLDVIQVGTILAIENGMQSVRLMKSLFQSYIILADIRIIKAGGKLYSLVFDSEQDWVTVVSDASKETVKAVAEEDNIRKNKDVQIQINESITNEQADYWKSLGITQLIYHRSNEVVDKE